MQSFNGFTAKFMERLNFPTEAKVCFADVFKSLYIDDDFSEKFYHIRHDYMYPTAHNLNHALKCLDALAEECGMSNYTLHMVFLISCAEILLLRYRERGIPESIYWDTMDDLRCKLLECIECKEVCGTFVAGWFHGFYEMTRFSLGRFEYEAQTYDHDTCTLKCGYVLEEGSPIVNFHIPSSGVSLSDEVRFASYRKAYKFYKHLFGDGPVVFCCSSWLLYRDHLDFLPEKSHIRNFINDFELLESEDSDRFNDAWRVFGKYADLPPEELPTDTSLRKAFAERLKAGKPTGHGFGVIVFDGKRIINKH